MRARETKLAAPRHASSWSLFRGQEMVKKWSSFDWLIDFWFKLHLTFVIDIDWIMQRMSIFTTEKSDGGMKLITNLYSFLVNFSWFLPHCLLLISFIILCLIFITLTWNRLRIFNFFLPSFFFTYPDFFKNRKQHLPFYPSLNIQFIGINYIHYVMQTFPLSISKAFSLPQQKLCAC